MDIKTSAREDGVTQIVSMPAISVIIPHYRDLVSLDICLSALEAQTYPRDRYEIIVGDNNSPEGEAAVAEVIAGRAKLTVIAAKGAGPARNGAVAIAQAPILAFTDSDCIPDPNWLTEGSRALEQHKSDFIGGRMTVGVKDPSKMTPEEAFERVFAFHNEIYVLRDGYTVTANLICTRELFDKVGGFLVGGIAEDCEWCFRARDLGFKIGYAPDAVVCHPARRTWADLIKKWNRSNADQFGLAQLKGQSRARWILKALAMPASAVVQTPRALFSPSLPTIGARLGAVAVLHRLRWWRLFHSLRLAFPARA